MRIVFASVTNKTGLAEFLGELVKDDYVVISTGGTERYLRDNMIPVMSVSDFTGMEEMLDGRVKTLDPKVFAGILARPNLEDRMTVLRKGWPEIDMVVVNLYDFKSAIRISGATFDSIIEQIDIGGPSLLRAAAKNWKRVSAVCDPADYAMVLRERKQPGWEQVRYRLAGKVFAHTSEYDNVIAEYMRSHRPA